MSTDKETREQTEEVAAVARAVETSVVLAEHKKTSQRTSRTKHVLRTASSLRVMGREGGGGDPGGGSDEVVTWWWRREAEQRWHAARRDTKYS
jgi:hypothetical protein